MEDKTLVCVDCGNEFIFTASEQEFFAEKGFTNEPKRCADCRAKKKQMRNRRGYNQDREMFDVICSECGKETQVPFQPRGDKPVYCSDCYRAKQNEFRNNY